MSSEIASDLTPLSLFPIPEIVHCWNSGTLATDNYISFLLIQPKEEKKNRNRERWLVHSVKMHPFVHVCRRGKHLKVWLYTNLKRKDVFCGCEATKQWDRSFQMPPQHRHTWQHICLGTLLKQNHSITFTPCRERALTIGHPNPLCCCCSLRLFHRSKVSRVCGTRRRGEECSVSFQSCACTSVPWGEKDGEGMEEEWRMRGVGGQWTKSAELDYIRLTLSGSVPYKPLPSP